MHNAGQNAQVAMIFNLKKEYLKRQNSRLLSHDIFHRYGGPPNNFPTLIMSKVGII